MQYIDVIVDNKSEYTDSLFTYRAPDDVRRGDLVSVDFAKRKKPIDAYVIATGVEPSFSRDKIKDVSAVIKEGSLSEEAVETAAWIRDRYGVKYIEALKLFAVPRPKRTKEPSPLKLKEAPEIELNGEQKAALKEISDSIEKGSGDVFLLKGVTNSGKTEVYMKAAEKAVETGKTAIILSPEIALSRQTEKRFKAKFGAENVAVLHSKLTSVEKYSEWKGIKEGGVKIVIGVRSAIFAPLSDIGLIVMDEEHEATYKSDRTPKYDTFDVAYKRAKAYDGTIVLGSATPSIVSYHRAKEGKYRLLELNERIGESRTPKIETVDMREEFRRGNSGVLSAKLYEGICEALEKKEQIILFLNRRGFSTEITCLDCGYRMMCDDCGIALTHHKSSNAAECHYCGRKYPLPKVCPQCGGEHISYSGAGTEKVEEKIGELFPNAKVDRFDLDTAKSQKEIDKTLGDFMAGRTDILIGTQILAKGLDFRNVGLVGIITADTTMNIPDYRSPERTFQLIMQVAGRAGRTAADSRVILQTFYPDDPVIKAAAASDYEFFYSTELQHRKTMLYPPYSDIIVISFTDRKSGGAKAAHPGGKADRSGMTPGRSVTMTVAEDFREKLVSMKGRPENAVIMMPKADSYGPGVAANRVSFFIKAPKGSRQGYIKAFLALKAFLADNKIDVYADIDINPYGMV